MMHTGASEATPQVANDDFALFVRQLYRMFKISAIHLMNNEAVTRTIEQSVRVLGEIQGQGFDELSVFFLNDTVFVNGTLLKANRDVYEAAQDLSRLLGRIGFNQITIGADAGFEDIKGMVAVASTQLRGAQAGDVDEPSAFPENATLRQIAPELLAELQSSATLTATDRVGRTYASAVVVMRFLYDNLKRGTHVVSRQLKRIAQQLVLLAETDSSAFLGVTRMRNVQDDEAGRAVNSAILAIVAARQLTSDIKTLSRIALSTLLFDVGRPRAAEMGRDPSNRLAVIPRLDDAQRRRLPSATAASLAAIGRLQDDALHRVVVGYEAQWMANGDQLGDLYGGGRNPRLESTLVWVARRFDDVLTFDVQTQRRSTPDEAIRLLRRAASDEMERFCVDLLLQALGLLPRGTVVRMASGYKGVIVANSDKPGLYGLPCIHLFADPDGTRVAGVLLDLAHPNDDVGRHGGIAEVLADESAPGDLPQIDVAVTPPPRPEPTRREEHSSSPIHSLADAVREADQEEPAAPPQAAAEHPTPGVDIDRPDERPLVDSDDESPIGLDDDIFVDLSAMEPLTGHDTPAAADTAEGAPAAAPGGNPASSDPAVEPAADTATDPSIEAQDSTPGEPALLDDLDTLTDEDIELVAEPPSAEPTPPQGPPPIPMAAVADAGAAETRADSNIADADGGRRPGGAGLLERAAQDAPANTRAEHETSPRASLQDPDHAGAPIRTPSQGAEPPEHLQVLGPVPQGGERWRIGDCGDAEGGGKLSGTTAGPMPGLATTAEVLPAAGERPKSPFISATATTDELVPDQSAAEAIAAAVASRDIEKEMFDILGSYYGDGGTPSTNEFEERTPSAILRAEHSLGAAEEALAGDDLAGDHIEASEPRMSESGQRQTVLSDYVSETTGPMPMISRNESTGEVSEPVAESLLRDYFPDSGHIVQRGGETSTAPIPRPDSPDQPQANRRYGEPDTLVDGLPDAEAILLRHLGGARDADSDQVLDPNAERILRSYLAEETRDKPRVRRRARRRTAPPNRAPTPRTAPLIDIDGLTTDQLLELYLSEPADAPRPGTQKALTEDTSPDLRGAESLGAKLAGSTPSATEPRPGIPGPEANPLRALADSAEAFAMADTIDGPSPYPRSVVEGAQPDLGADDDPTHTVEVSEEHAHEVLRDYLRRPAVAARSEAAPDSADPETPPRAALAARSGRRRPTAALGGEATREVGASEADALLDRFITRRRVVDEQDAERLPPATAAPTETAEATREIGKHVADEMLNRFVKKTGDD